MRRKSKKGSLLKFIIEAFVSLIILFLLFKLTTNVFSCKTQEEMQAKGTIDNLKHIIKNIENTKEANYLLIPLPGWKLVFMPSNLNVVEGMEKPESFFGEDVLCICKKKCKAEFCFPSKKIVNEKGQFLKMNLDSFFNLWIYDKEDYILFSLNEEEISYEIIPNEEEIKKIKEDYKKTSKDIIEIIERVSEKYGVDSNLVKAVVYKESEFNPLAVSPCGAVGLMQMIAATAIENGLKVAIKTEEGSKIFDDYEEYKNYLNENDLWIECRKDICKTKVGPCNSCTKQYCDYENDERFDIEKNLEAGIKHLKYLLNKYKEVKYALAAYHEGTGKIDKQCECEKGVCQIKIENCVKGEVKRYVESIIKNKVFFETKQA